MANFEIYFHGLICFYGDGELRHGNTSPKTDALFVIDDQHTRFVVTPDDTDHFVGFTRLTIAITGGTTAPVSAAKRAFQLEVPHLGDDSITTSACDGVNANTADAVRVALPQAGGTLDVAQTYDHEGDYELNGHHHTARVARVTVWSFQAESVTIRGDGLRATDVVVQPDSFVVLMNASANENDLGDHFQRYYRVLTKGGVQATPADVATVKDDCSTHPVDVPRGNNVAAVKGLDLLKAASAVKLAIDRQRPEYGALSGLCTHVLTQTQCSNSQWP